MSGKRFFPSLGISHIVLLVSAVTMAIALVVILILSNSVKTRAVADLAREEARQTSRLVFQGLYSVMRKGWKKADIEQAVQGYNKALPGLNIRVFRGASVIRQYGEIPGEAEIRAKDIDLKEALGSGIDVVIATETNIRYLFPIKVDEECTECHNRANVGDVNGVIDVTYPINKLKVSLDFVLNSVIASFLIVLAILFTIIYFKLKYLIAIPISKLAQLMRDIMQRHDLSRRIESEGAWVAEVGSLSTDFNKMLRTLSDYEHRLEDLAERDPLTSLFNRRKFEEFLAIEIDRSIRHGHSFTLIMVDVDNFKHLNDTFGHPVGDLALKAIAAQIDERIRRTDVLARVGGDEFALLLPETDIVRGTHLAEKLRRDLAETPISLPVGETRVSISVGLVGYPYNGSTLEKLVISMDVAMYKAKRLGRNRVATIDDADHVAVMEVFTQGESVRDALLRDRVEPFYQPIIDVKTGEIFAFELLARIREGDGHIPASRFIETADQLGLAEEIDMVMFDKGLSRLRQNPGKAKWFFNLSPRTLSNGTYMRAIPERLREAGVPLEQIVFEITEREALPRIGEISGLIDELRAKGIQFALDDFGSGFSSFLYLKLLSVDYVKIEGSFVRAMATDNRDRIMVEHINSMAKRFGLITIAEYVEDEETNLILKELGIDHGQGFHYAMPGKDPI